MCRKTEGARILVPIIRTRPAAAGARAAAHPIPLSGDRPASPGPIEPNNPKRNLTALANRRFFALRPSSLSQFAHNVAFLAGKLPMKSRICMFSIATLLLGLMLPRNAAADFGFHRGVDGSSMRQLAVGIDATPLGTDYKCMNDCTAAGYMYSFCQDKCSYEDDYRRPKQTDYKCMNDCTSAGYQYSYCRDRCSY